MIERILYSGRGLYLERKNEGIKKEYIDSSSLPEIGKSSKYSASIGEYIYKLIYTCQIVNLLKLIVLIFLILIGKYVYFLINYL